MIKLPWLEPSKWAGSHAVNSSTRTVFRISQGNVMLTLQQNPHTQVTRTPCRSHRGEEISFERVEPSSGCAGLYIIEGERVSTESEDHHSVPAGDPARSLVPMAAVGTALTWAGHRGVERELRGLCLCPPGRLFPCLCLCSHKPVPLATKGHVFQTQYVEAPRPPNIPG